MIRKYFKHVLCFGIREAWYSSTMLEPQIGTHFALLSVSGLFDGRDLARVRPARSPTYMMY